jgi:hypothetical protein
VSFINASWEPCHEIIGIFEVHNTTSATMANQVKLLLDSFGLFDKIIAYVKDEGFNLNNLTFIVSYFALHPTCPFVRSCFGHAMSKALNMILMTIKSMLNFQKLI